MYASLSVTRSSFTSSSSCRIFRFISAFININNQFARKNFGKTVLALLVKHGQSAFIIRLQNPRARWFQPVMLSMAFNLLPSFASPDSECTFLLEASVAAVSITSLTNFVVSLINSSSSLKASFFCSSVPVAKIFSRSSILHLEELLFPFSPIVRTYPRRGCSPFLSSKIFLHLDENSMRETRSKGDWPFKRRYRATGGAHSFYKGDWVGFRSGRVGSGYSTSSCIQTINWIFIEYCFRLLRCRSTCNPNQFSSVIATSFNSSSFPCRTVSFRLDSR